MSEKLKTEENEFTGQGFPSVPSLYRAMYYTKDFADRDENGEYVMNNKDLKALGDMWAFRKHDPETSPRAQKEIDTLLGRVAFELVMRQQELNDGE